MSELTDNGTLDGLAEAGRLMEEAARLDGIDEQSPLGRWIRAQRKGMDAFARVVLSCASEMQNFRGEARDIIEMAKQEQTTLRDQFIESRQQVEKLGEVAARNVEKQELFRDRELQATLGRIVSGVTSELRKEVFDQLRTEIPTHERQFYKEARWRAYVRMTLAGAVLVGLGFASGYTYDGYAASVGRYCAEHQAFDTKGASWCQINPPPILPKS
ncbi:hypothetical protein [Gluconobacter cerinus]|uniref:Uncharacterized protein n=1 Tax=Gluconobacter cerinus TaxID=38307 RepID=A0A1B6VFJ0_9PROT|nr:hypothetical protein [Gluconobacter cerinus]OAJ65983.1 hypothetical protein A0123_03386 [Gluconobacter cerinus]